MRNEIHGRTNVQSRPVVATLIALAAVLGGGSLLSPSRADCTLSVSFRRNNVVGQQWYSVAMTSDRVYAEEIEYSSPDLYRLVTYDISGGDAVLLGVSSPQTSSFFGGTDSVALGTLFIGVADSGPDSGNLVIYQMSDPNNPLVIGTLDLPGNIRALELGGNIVYARSGGRLDAISVADPFSPVSIGSLPLATDSDIEVTLGAPRDNILPVRNGADIALVDISDPTNLSILGATLWHGGDRPDNPTIVGNAVVGVVYDQDPNTPLAVIDISDPTNPVPLPDYGIAADVGPIDYGLKGGRASGFVYYVTEVGSATRRTFAIDFTNPNAPVPVDQKTTWTDGTFANALSMVGSRLLVSGISQFTVFDTSSCATPPSIAANPVSQATDEGGASIVLNTTTSLGTSWQWFRDGQPLADDAIYSGATAEDLTIAADLSAAGIYTLEVYNGDGSDTSLPAIVAIRPTTGVATGACCLPMGDCVVTTEADCTTAGGSYNGDGSDCGSVVCEPACAGDLNGDDVIDLTDLGLLLASYGVTCP